ncbi:MAG: tetratricopeptide repeat protein [Nitrospinaceae bacterium]|jgi:tetratricopeptide (TPR) repeat protein|nr:tetratricopeptide repeat protein [Nitrospina sp.]MBT5377116.1 tetratricopeptide repeat protein [Nitrospinaceae bacterium]
MQAAVVLALFLIGSQASLAWALDPEQWFQEGNRFSTEGKLEEAVQAYQKSISGNPLSPVAHYNLGVAYKKLQQLDKAAKSFEQCIELEPVNMEARVSLGNIYNLQKRWFDAIAQLNIVVHRRKGDAEAHGNLGWAYYNYKKGPPFKKMVILNLSRAVALFEEQNLMQAATATQKILEEARNKFGTSLVQ